MFPKSSVGCGRWVGGERRTPGAGAAPMGPSGEGPQGWGGPRGGRSRLLQPGRAAHAVLALAGSAGDYDLSFNLFLLASNTHSLVSTCVLLLTRGSL